MIPKRVLLAAATLLLVGQSPAGESPRIAIIIDDLGYQLEAGRRAIELPGPLAYAILPATPRGEYLAQLAREHGKEVLLHLPLEAAGRLGAEERGAIVLEMSRADLRAAFASAMDSVPGAVGISSHRGSLLTRHPGHMGWLMDEIALRDGLFFVDSYTTHHSIALQIAREAGIAAAKRDVFLDHERREPAIRRELERLKRLARERGAAIAVGHPYPETLEILEQALPEFANDGIELVPLSDLVT